VHLTRRYGGRALELSCGSARRRGLNCEFNVRALSPARVHQSTMPRLPSPAVDTQCCRRHPPPGPTCPPPTTWTCPASSTDAALGSRLLADGKTMWTGTPGSAGGSEKRATLSASDVHTPPRPPANRSPTPILARSRGHAPTAPQQAMRASAAGAALHAGRPAMSARNPSPIPLRQDGPHSQSVRPRPVSGSAL